MAFPLAAIIAAAGTLGSAFLGSRAANRATRAQQDASRRAEAWEREQEMRRRQEHDAAEAWKRQQWEAEEARRRPYRDLADSLLAREAGELGIPFVRPSRPTGPPPTGPLPPGAATMSEPRTLADFAGLRSPTTPSMMADEMLTPPPGPRTLADLWNWNRPR